MDVAYVLLHCCNNIWHPNKRWLPQGRIAYWMDFTAIFILYIFSCVVYGILKKNKLYYLYIYLIFAGQKSCDPRISFHQK